MWQKARNAGLRSYSQPSRRPGGSHEGVGRKKNYHAARPPQYVSWKDPQHEWHYEPILSTGGAAKNQIYASRSDKTSKTKPKRQTQFFLSYASVALARSSHNVCADERIRQCMSKHPILGSRKWSADHYVVLSPLQGDETRKPNQKDKHKEREQTTEETRHRPTKRHRGGKKKREAATRQNRKKTNGRNQVHYKSITRNIVVQ